MTKWTCDVCKKAIFDTFEEAEAHEKICKGPDYVEAPTAITDSEGKTYTTVWTCDVCRMQEFSTYEEAVDHEAKCSFVTSFVPGSMGKKCFVCDVCQLAYFNDYKTACIHEETCSGKPQHMEQMVPEFPNVLDIIDVTKSKKVPLRGRPLLDISPMVQEVHSTYKSFQSLPEHPPYAKKIIMTLDCIEKPHPGVNKDKYYRLVNFRCHYCKFTNVKKIWNTSSVATDLVYDQGSHLLSCPKCPQAIKNFLKSYPPKSFESAQAKAFSSFVDNFCLENKLENSTLELHRKKGRFDYLSLELPPSDDVAPTNSSSSKPETTQTQAKDMRTLPQCQPVPKSRAKLPPPPSSPPQTIPKTPNTPKTPKNDVIVIDSPSLSPSTPAPRASTGFEMSPITNGSKEQQSSNNPIKKTIQPLPLQRPPSLQRPIQAPSPPQPPRTVQSPEQQQQQHPVAFKPAPSKTPIDYTLWAQDKSKAMSQSSFRLGDFAQIKELQDKLSPFNSLAVSQLHFRVLSEEKAQTPSPKGFRRLQLRCNHCGAASNLHNLDVWYKTIYAVSYSHFCKTCKYIPTHTRQALITHQHNAKKKGDNKPLNVGLKQFCKVVANFYNLVELPGESNPPIGVLYNGPSTPSTQSKKHRKRNSASTYIEETIKRHKSGMYMPCQRNLPHYGDDGSLAYLLPTDSVPIISSLVKDKALKLNYHYRTVLDNFEFCNEGNKLPGRGQTLALRCQNCKYSKEDPFIISLEAVEGWSSAIFTCRNHLEKCKCIPVKNRKDIVKSKAKCSPTEHQPLTVNEFCDFITDVYGLKNEISGKDGSVIGVIWGEAKYILAPYSSIPNGIKPRLESKRSNVSQPVTPTHNLMLPQRA